jgi:peptidoglycan lytic transglycosylase
VNFTALRGRRLLRRRAAAVAALLALALAAAGCAHHRRVPVTVPPTTAPAPGGPSPTPPPPVAPGAWVERGLASWYGVPYHGHRAADGEIFDMYQMVAAHRTLPFNSIVRVTDLRNGRQAEVRIIDRGPFVEGRIIDLSFAAARALDMVAAGVVPVRLELVAGSNPSAGEFTVQVGAFTVETNAQRLRRRLAERYHPVFIQEYDSPAGLFFRVRVGKVGSIEGARQLARELTRREKVESFVVRLDR